MTVFLTRITLDLKSSSSGKLTDAVWTAPIISSFLSCEANRFSRLNIVSDSILWCHAGLESEAISQLPERFVTLSTIRSQLRGRSQVPRVGDELGTGT